MVQVLALSGIRVDGSSADPWNMLYCLANAAMLISPCWPRPAVSLSFGLRDRSSSKVAAPADGHTPAFIESIVLVSLRSFA